jgi:hypothetical protein
MIASYANVVAQTQPQDVFPTWRWIIEPQYDVAWSFYEDLAAVRQNGKWGFIDKSGNFVIEPQFDGVRNFSDGMAAIKQKGKWGYANSNGEVVIEPKYYEAYDFKEDIARVERFANDENHHINKNGHVTPVVPVKKKSKTITPTNRNVFQSAKNGKFGFTDKNKNWVIQPEFSNAKEFNDNVACVSKNGKWGFIALLEPFEYVNEYIKTQLNTSQPSDIGAELIVLFDKAIDNLVKSSLLDMELARAEISDYDEEHSTFLVSVPVYGDLVINVEKEDSRSLKANWDHVKFTEPTFTIARNIETEEPQIILTSVNIVNTLNKNKVHAWNSNDRYENKNASQEPKFQYTTLREAFDNTLPKSSSVKSKDKTKANPKSKDDKKVNDSENKEVNKVNTENKDDNKVDNTENKEDNKINSESTDEKKVDNLENKEDNKTGSEIKDENKVNSENKDENKEDNTENKEDNKVNSESQDENKTSEESTDDNKVNSDNTDDTKTDTESTDNKPEEESKTE